MERKLPRKKFLREVVFFFRNFGKCCSVRYWKLRKIQNRCFAWMESAPSFYYSYDKPSSYGMRPWTPPSKNNMKVHVCWWVNAAFNFGEKNESAIHREWLLLSKNTSCNDSFWFLSLMIKQPIRRTAMTFVAKKMLCALLELNETNLSVAALTCVHKTPSVGEYFSYNSGMSCNSPSEK